MDELPNGYEEPLRVGDVICGTFRVLDPVGFAGSLPSAELTEREPNAGVHVILTSTSRTELFLTSRKRAELIAAQKAAAQKQVDPRL